MSSYWPGKVMVVTGAGHGIGEAVALHYGALGATVVVTDIDGSTAARTASTVTGAGGAARAFALDVRDAAAIASVFGAVETAFGRCDVLINNAGVSRMYTDPVDLDVAEWDDILAVNLRGPFLCARAAARLMRTTGAGRIVNISSTRAFMSEHGGEAYASSKSGLIGLTHALAISLGPVIAVNAIAPGWIETRAPYESLPPVSHSQHPAGRVGKPADVARACAFLTGEGQDFVTGAVLVLDGGTTRKMIYDSGTWDGTH